MFFEVQAVHNGPKGCCTPGYLPTKHIVDNSMLNTTFRASASKHSQINGLPTKFLIKMRCDIGVSVVKANNTINHRDI